MFSTILLTSLALTVPNHIPESAYRDAWCMGETEVRLPNGTRADCVTTRYVVEVERAPKWHEAIGQVLDYSQQTGKQPAILLIIEQPSDWHHYRRLLPVARHYHVRVWYITPRRIQ